MNKVSSAHIGLLVLDCFNAAIAFADMNNRMSYDTDARAWCVHGRSFELRVCD